MRAPSGSSTPDRVGAADPTVGPITRRLIYALALLPIVPATAIAGVVVVQQHIGTWSDELRMGHLLISVLFVSGTILIWRKAVLWTLGRKWLTALVACVPFIQVLYAKPLWDAGCIDNDILRAGQHEVGIGLWVWLSIWVWWGWERTQMGKDKEATGTSRLRMSGTARRIVASIGTIPAVFGLTLIIAMAIDDFLGAPDSPARTYSGGAVVAVTMWVLIWRRGVVWSCGVARRTVAAGLTCLALPIVISFGLWNVGRGNDLLQAVAVSLPVIGWGAWMAVTIRIWPLRATSELAEDRSPRCLRCGYLLIGLRATRCPECGDEPTLDELWRVSFGTEV